MGFEFLAKWISKSNSNIHVSTNSPTDTYCQCLPYTASTPPPPPPPNSLSTLSRRTVTRSEACGRKWGLSVLLGKAQHPARGSSGGGKVAPWHDGFSQYHHQTPFSRTNHLQVPAHSVFSFQFTRFTCSRMKMTSPATAGVIFKMHAFDQVEKERWDCITAPEMWNILYGLL